MKALPQAMETYFFVSCVQYLIMKKYYRIIGTYLKAEHLNKETNVRQRSYNVAVVELYTRQ